MNTSQPNQTNVRQMPQPLVPGGRALREQADERELVKLYVELTAESESQARSVLMFIGCQSEGSTTAVQIKCIQ